MLSVPSTATPIALQASPAHASSGRLSARHFQHVVLYASEPEAQQALQPFLKSCFFPQHLLQVVVGPYDKAQRPAAAASQQQQPQQQLGRTGAAAGVSAMVGEWSGNSLCYCMTVERS